jgi:RNA polymerase sigma-70 factor (ECF subfamily)
LIERTLGQGLSDEEVVARVRAGEVALFEVVMRRYNRRLYRAARIAVHEALARARRAGRFLTLEENEIEEKMALPTSSCPEKRVADRELASVLETAIEALPAPYRAVFMLRDVEELNTAETAECLDIREETVKTRLHRARALLREGLAREIGAAVRESFEFGFARCDRLVARVLTRIQACRPPASDVGRQHGGDE